MRKRVVHLLRTKRKTWCGRWNSTTLRAVRTWNAFMEGSRYASKRGRSCKICYHAYIKDARRKRSKRKKTYFK